MSILFIVSVSLLLACCLALIVLILMQNQRASGLGKAMGGMGAQQTFWDKNKGRSLEGTLEKYTKILGAAIMIISLLLNLQFFL